MSSQPYSLEYVGEMIDFLDQHIAAGTDTPEIHATLQQRLDAISLAFANDPRFDEYYPHMLELQALLHGRRSPNATDEKALRFMKEAVREAGSVHKLRSSTIKDYIVNHMRQQAAAAASIHAQRPEVITQEEEETIGVDRGQEMPDVPQQPGSFKPRRRTWGKFPRLHMSRKKALATTAISLVVLAAGGFVFAPHASVLASVLTNHSKIATEKKLYETLTAQYQSCASKLSSERASINTNNMQQLSAFNQETEQCQAVQQQQQQAADAYNKLIGS